MLSLKFLYNSPLGAFVTGWRTKRGGGGGAEGEEDPLRAAYVRSVPRAQCFRGVLLQGYLVHPAVLRGLDAFEVRDDDVFIATYPKSGTTWTEEIVSLIHEGGNESRVRHKLLNERVEHLEVGRPLGHLRHLRRLPSPRLLATHLPLPLVPRGLRAGRCKMIYVVRNPKDNAVSYFHHHRMSTFLGNYQGSWDDFLHLFIKGHLVYGSWFDHVLPYWRFCQEHPDRMLFVSYEDLKLDLPGMVSKIALFLGKRLSSEAIANIARHCTFEQMKSNTMVNREVLPISDLFDMTHSKFMRKGIIGDWKNYFTEEQNAAFSKLYDERMKNSGLELIFDPEEIDSRNNNATKTFPDDPLTQNVENGEAQNGYTKNIQNGDVDNKNSNIQNGVVTEMDAVENYTTKPLQDCDVLNENSKDIQNGVLSEMDATKNGTSEHFQNGDVQNGNSKYILNGDVSNMNGVQNGTTKNLQNGDTNKMGHIQFMSNQNGHIENSKTKKYKVTKATTMQNGNGVHLKSIVYHNGNSKTISCSAT